jgi:2-polyprenyl-3-methyl-5-hydroxy-6-metoxy-1,4-benzoquinol methylase
MSIERPNETATGDFEFAALNEAHQYRAALVQEFSPHLQGNVLEIGAGIGQITTLLAGLPKIGRLVCVEPNPSFCHAFRETLPDQTLIEGTIAHVPPGEPWNCVLSINVLEHIRDDEPELTTYRKLLSAGRGRVCLFVPARPEIYAPIDRDFGHHRRYTRSELARKLDASGFEILQLHYFNCVGYFAWWLNFCVFKKRRFNVTAVRGFDRVIFPAVHWSESRLCRPPIGQSLVAVASARP